MQCFVRTGGVISVMRLWPQYLNLQLEYASLNLESFSWSGGFSKPMSWSSCQNEVISEFSKVLAFQVVSSEVSVRMLSLL